MISFIAFNFLILSAIILIDLFSKKYSIKPSDSRKFSHIATSLIICLMPIFLTRDEIILTGSFFAILLFVTKNNNIFPSIHSVERKTYGEIFLPIAVVVCAFLFLPGKSLAFQFGILMMGISDALASLIGERFGTHIIKILGYTKSFEGSLVFFISCVIITSIFTQRVDLGVVLISLILTIVELVSVIGIDNLILPVIGSYLICFLI